MKKNITRSSPRVISALGLALSAGLLLSACGGTASGAGAADTLEAMEPVTLTLSDLGSEAVNGTIVQSFIDEVEEKSGGKILIDPFYSGTLAGPTEALGAVSSGSADIGLILAHMYPTELPVAFWGNNLAADASGAYPLSVFEGPAAHADFALDNDALVEEFDKHNARILWSALIDTRYPIICKDPVTSLADAKGKRTHVSGTVQSGVVESLGMVPTTLSTAELFEALQRGVIDCVVNPPSGYKGFSLYEAAKQVTVADFSGTAGTYMIMNNDSFNALPTEGQKILLEAQAGWVADRATNTVGQYEYLYDAQEEFGVSIHEADADLRDAIEDSRSNERTEALKSAPAELSNPESFLDDYAASFNKWESLLSTELGLAPDTGGAKVEDLSKGADVDMVRYEELLREEIYTPYTEGLTNGG